MDELREMLEHHWYESGSYLEALDRTRPYNGQPHTDLGIRGKHEVSGLTMRDIRDAFIIALYRATGLPPEDYPRTVYEIDLAELDPVAVSQNLTCVIEERMGIFPNTPKLLED